MGLDNQRVQEARAASAGSPLRTSSKRIFDIVVASTTIILILPMYLLITAAILITSPGPVFFTTLRVGMNGRKFKVFKFRTMVPNADKMGPALTVSNDPRITRVRADSATDQAGRTASVVQRPARRHEVCIGPRPEDPRYVALYTPGQYACIFSVRPGVTSPASIAFRNEENLLEGSDWETTYVQKILPSKLALDMEYIHHAHVLLDAAILFSTVKALIK